jgi:hypothetical protein
MRKSALCKLFAGIGISITLFTSCVDDTNLDLPPVADQSFTEEFDTAASALSRGWKFINSSSPRGGNVWQEGGEIVPWFPAYSNAGNRAGFIGADYTSTSAAAGEISNWALSPVVTMQNGDTITFYTRAVQYDDGAGDSTDYSNRLQVRASINGSSFSTGTGDGSGDFTKLLLDINPTYQQSSLLTPVPNAYPAYWTRFQALVYGLDKPTQGRFAFRYFVQGGGNNGLGSGVAIDRVRYRSVGHNNCVESVIIIIKNES